MNIETAILLASINDEALTHVSAPLEPATHTITKPPEYKHMEEKEAKQNVVEKYKIEKAMSKDRVHLGFFLIHIQTNGKAKVMSFKGKQIIKTIEEAKAHTNRIMRLAQIQKRNPVLILGEGIE